MYSVKKNVLQVVALLKAHKVKHIVLSPGSRNAPLLHTFSNDSFFTCHTIVDERNAGFYAIGIIQALQETVAICCTSGTALLNYSPAVAEAYYQGLPLIVISADRTQEWIGQMDGQTIPQPQALKNIVAKSVHLPEINNEEDEWYCNRLVNEAIVATTHPKFAPVHINIPISEPLFDYSQATLPTVRKIEILPANKNIDINSLANQLAQLPKRVIVVGQQLQNEELREQIQKFALEKNCVVLCEHISNCKSKAFIDNFDSILYQIDGEQDATLAPDLVISLGGHITSKRLKKFLRTNSPKEHWHISPSGEIVDLYQCLTKVIESDAHSFFSAFGNIVLKMEYDTYTQQWKSLSDKIVSPHNLPFSDISAMGSFLDKLPNNSILHLSNSSSVRNAQLFDIDSTTNVLCNKGTNGIESPLPTAIGTASVSDKPVYLAVGDISFFYTVGALWNTQHIRNLRILLINNSCGGIFHQLPGLSEANSLDKHVAVKHTNTAEYWAKAAELQYISASNSHELDKALEVFVNDDCTQSILLEISTDIEISKIVMQSYYHKLKNINN